MNNNIQPLINDPAALTKVTAGLELPFNWDPANKPLDSVLNETKHFWQNDEDGAMPQGFVDALNKSLNSLRTDGLERNSISVGDYFPLRILQNHLGEHINMADLVKSGPLVIMFYRGGWCPYCNLALRAFQHSLEDIKAKGAQLVAISPEKPDSSLSTSEKAGLAFNVLSDQSNALAKDIGIVWDIPDYALEWHEKYFGLFLEEHNGQGNNASLPVPATFIVGENGKVLWKYIEAEYWMRASPTDVLSRL